MTYTWDRNIYCRHISAGISLRGNTSGFKIQDAGVEFVIFPEIISPIEKLLHHSDEKSSLSTENPLPEIVEVEKTLIRRSLLLCFLKFFP